jgi:predicted NAD/FAD-dependent oxidoreductase
MSNSATFTTDTLIIGAGLCGLTLGNKLQNDCVIIEKSQGLGGRIANRRIQDQGFDHGASHLKDDPLLKNLFFEQSLHLETQKDVEGIFLKNSMTRLPKKMASNLVIKKSTKAELIFRSNDFWTIETDNGEKFAGKNLILTAPLPQSLELLSKSQINYPENLKNICYSKALMVLVVLKEYAKPDLIYSEFIHSILPMKERDLHPRGFVVRGNPEFSDMFFDEKEEGILGVLIREFKKGFSSNIEIEYQELKKWRYVTPLSSLPCPYTEVASGLFITGDAFLYPDVRGSLHGAFHLAEKLNRS